MSSTTDLLLISLLGTKVAPVIVAEMVVRGDTEGLDSSIDEELGEDRLELRLPALQVVAAEERLVELSQLDAPRDEGVMRSTVDERYALQDRRDGEERRGGYLIVRRLDRIQEVVHGVVHAWKDIGITFSVGSPKYNDLLGLIVGLELADIGAETLKVGLLVVAGKEVIRTLLLVSCDKVGVVG
jgi:hypothetical protein